MTPEEIFLAHRTFIEKAATAFFRKARLPPQDLEDFISEVNFHFIKDDYRVLREFKGRANLKTYLTTVIINFGQDYRHRMWGKWRPSEEAKRQGEPVLTLERLVYRDGHGFDEACELLRRNHGVTESVRELADLFAKLHPRPRKRVEGEEAIADRASTTNPADERLVERERQELAKKLLRALKMAFRSLPEEEQVFLGLMAEEASLATIARLLGTEQKPLYRRREKLLRLILSRVEEERIRAADVLSILGESWPEELRGFLRGDAGEDGDENGGPGTV